MGEVNERFGGSFDEGWIKRIEAGEGISRSNVENNIASFVAISAIFVGIFSSMFISLCFPSQDMPAVFIIGIVILFALIIIGLAAFRPYTQAIVEQSHIILREFRHKEEKIEFQDIVAIRAGWIKARSFSLIQPNWSVKVCHRTAGLESELHWTDVIYRNEPELARALGAVIAHRADLSDMTHSIEPDESLWRSWKRAGVEELPPLEV